MRRWRYPIARAEARHLAKQIERLLANPPPGYSMAHLARALAQRDAVQLRLISTALPVIALLLLVGIAFLSLPLWVDESSEDARSVFGVAGAAAYCAFLGGSGAMAWRYLRTLESKERLKYIPPRVIAYVKRTKGLIAVAIPGFMLGLTIFIIMLAFRMSPAALFQAAFTSVGALLWVGMLMVPATPFSGRMLTLRVAPDAELIRWLATAFALTVDASPAQWRSFRYRQGVTARVAAAAGILEDIYRRSLSLATPAPEARSWMAAEESSRRLRALAATIALSDQGSRGTIERLTAAALAAAVAGQPGAFPAVGMDLAKAPSLGVPRRNAWIGRWLVSAVAPALAIVVLVLAAKSQGWVLIGDNSSLFIQLAVLVFIVGTTAAFDPTGYDKRLGAITGAGGSLFGWGKSKG